MRKILENTEKYLSLVKFSHTIFALPFAFIGFFLAMQKTEYSFNIILFVLVLLCMVFARNAAMAFNRFVDRKIDKQNPRTKNREIPAKKIKASSALYFAVINALFFIGTTFFINELCFYLSPVALVIIFGYSYTKRFTVLCHLILGLGLSLAPIGAYLAVAGEFNLLPVLFSLAVLFWVSGFDIIYSLQDFVFDKTNNLRSIPVILGKKVALLISILLHIIAAALLAYAGLLQNFGTVYWIGMTIFSTLLIYQHLIIKPTDFQRINIAFFTTNGIASVIFAVFVIIDLFIAS